MRACAACAQVWDPDALADTSTAHLQHRHKLTPYKDVRLHGRVHATFVRGHQVMATMIWTFGKPGQIKQC